MARKKISAEFKSKIVLKALKEQNTVNEIASEFQVHPVQISKWKKQVIEGLPSLFESQRAEDNRSKHQLVEAKATNNICRYKEEREYWKL